MKVLLKRSATAKGGRNGDIHAQGSGLSFDLAMPEEMGGKPNKKTNPEEIFSVGYSSCFASSIEYILQSSEIAFENITVDVTTKLVQDDENKGFKFAVEVTADIEGIDTETADDIIQKAYQFCPYSRAIRNNVDVTINQKK